MKIKKKNCYSERFMSIGIIVGLLCFALGWNSFIYIKEELPHHLLPYYEGEYSNKPQGSEYDVGNDFKTHLPLIIINTHGQEPKADSVWDEIKGYRVPVESDPYVRGNIQIIDNQTKINTIMDEPSIESDIQIRLRGNSSLAFDKKQYFIKLVDEDGNKNAQNILGMGEEWEWILNISFIDKSLLRNYMCLNIAGKIMPNIPDVRFCEVLIKEGENYEYRGVYLMMESIKKGKDRVNIAKYDPNFTASSYILRRDRFDETGTMMNNYGTHTGLVPSYLEIKYPAKKDITKRTIRYIEQEMSVFEQTIFSEDAKSFFKYNKYIDRQSFIDYFIINEFFANYDAGYNSTYIHKENTGKITMGPVWDFDHAIDNFDHTKLNLETTAMHDAPWFRQLLRDKNFVDRLVKRYHELRKDVLSEENIMKFIDETIKYLGPAQKRDWSRWEYFYTDKYLFNMKDEQGNEIDRNTKSYEEEILKIKYILTTHGDWLDENIESLYQFVTFQEEELPRDVKQKIEGIILGSDEKKAVGNFMTILFIGICIITIILVQRE